MNNMADDERLFRLMHNALVMNVPNFGGHHGIHGMMRGLREEMMKQTGLVCGKIREKSLSEQDSNEYIALCQTAVSTGVLSESDLQTIVSIVERSI